MMKKQSDQNKLRTLAAAALFIATAALFTGCGGGGDDAADSSSDADGGDAPTAAPAGGQMVLTTEIPPQKIEGTPKAIKVPVLEPAPQEAPKMRFFFFSASA